MSIHREGAKRDSYSSRRGGRSAASGAAPVTVADEPYPNCKAAAASLERSVRREWLFRIQDEHDQPMQFFAAAVRNLHRIFGRPTRQRLTGFDNVYAVRGLLAQLTL